MSACFDWDYGPYRNDPRDPRYDDSEELAREEWEADNAITEILSDDSVNEILFELLHGSRDKAFSDIEKAMDAAWEQEKKKQED
jgi:hypothetical protein